MKKFEKLLLSTTSRTQWYDHSGGPLKVVADFGAIDPDTTDPYTSQFTAQVADATGTLELLSWPAQQISFYDANGDPQTQLTISSALDNTAFEFCVEQAPEGRYRLVFTHATNGSADVAAIYWG